MAELGQPYLAGIRPAPGPLITCPADIAKHLTPLLADALQEELWVLCLNARNRVIASHMVYRGSVNSAQVRMSELFRCAVKENAPAIVMAHNHPSGDPEPSEPDIHITRMAVDAAKLLDIALLDHVVIAADRFYSFKEHGRF